LLIARESGSPKAVGGGSLDVGPLERFSQNLCPLSRGANASSGGSGGGRGINKSGRRGNAKMLGDGSQIFNDRNRPGLKLAFGVGESVR
jgi:hypothetical protein